MIPFTGNPASRTDHYDPTPSPNQTLGGLMGAIGTAAGVLSGGAFAPASMFGALAVSQALGMQPTYSMNEAARGAMSQLSNSIMGRNDPLAGDKNPYGNIDPEVAMAGPTANGLGNISRSDLGEIGSNQQQGPAADTLGNPQSNPYGGNDPENSNAMAAGGLVQLAGGGKIARGIGGGLDDLIPTTINGRQAARLSDGEFVMPADVVSMLGDGSSNAGSQRLYDMVKAIRQQKTGDGKQAGPLEIGSILRRLR